MTSTLLGTGYRAAESAHLALPRIFRPGERRGVISKMGAGSIVTNYGFYWRNAYQALPLGKAGYPFITGDVGNVATYQGQTFGNDDSLTALTALWNYAKTNCGFKTDKFCVYGESMGTVTWLDWAIQGTNASLIVAAVLCMPAFDVDGIYQANQGGWERASIQTAFGIVYPTPIPNLATKSPYAFSDADKAKLTFPIRLYASTNDPYFTLARAQTWATSVNALTGLNNVSVVSTGAIGHAVPSDVSFGDPLVEFYNANGGRL